MKVILLDNVRKVGQKGEIVEVNDGYGRNFLIKRGLAKIAAGGNLKEVENKKALKKKQEESQNLENKERFKKINQSQVKIRKPVNKEGRLFAAVHKKDIAQEVGLSEENIILNKDIKELGTFEIDFKLGEDKGKIFLVISS